MNEGFIVEPSYNKDLGTMKITKDMGGGGVLRAGTSKITLL